jgi:hypothetical protein
MFEKLYNLLFEDSLKKNPVIKIMVLAFIGVEAAGLFEIYNLNVFSADWWIALITGILARGFYWGSIIVIPITYINGVNYDISTNHSLPSVIDNLLYWLYIIGMKIENVTAFLVGICLPGTIIAACVNRIVNSSFDLQDLAVMALGDYTTFGTSFLTYIAIGLRIMAALLFVFIWLAPEKKEEPPKIVHGMNKRAEAYIGSRDRISYRKISEVENENY